MEHCRHVGVPLVEEVVQGGGGGVRQEDGRLPALQQEAGDIVYLSPDQTRPGPFTALHITHTWRAGHICK